MSRRLLAAVAIPFSAFAALIAVPLPSGLAQNICSNQQSSQQLDARIDRLIAQMTVEERIAQLQDRAPAIPRLGLPAYNWWNEGLHGLARNGYATVFPQAIGLAATWDPALLREVGDTISTEARAKFNPHKGEDSPRYGGLTIWSPNINIFRDPRWGRGQETYGEDPFLTASLGTQFVEGIQGSDSFYLKADATPKHFVAHSGPEEGRDGFNSQVTAHDLADTYLPAFHALTTDAKAAALMCSYNAIDGIPSCANTGLLQRTVRDHWGFGGYVVSDCDAVGNITEYQHYTADAAHGAAAALNAGVDLDCGNTYAALQKSFAQKLVSEETIDRSLHRLLLARLRLGMMDQAGCSPYDHLNAADNDTPQHRALTLRAAEESVVLLKNDGTLPLKPAQSVAVIGPTADMLKVLEANYHGTASNPVTPLEGLREAFKNVHYAQGSLLAAGVSAPIPRTALRTGSGPDASEGLNAEYFERPSFEGKPLIKETVGKVDLDLDRVGPDSKITATHYAARWSGWLVPPSAGDYVLHVNVERCWDCTTHDQFRLLVDSKPVLENDGTKAQPDRVTLHFAKGSPHAIQLELLHTGEDEGIALEWEPPAEALLAEAVEAARRSDVIVAFVGLSPDLEGEALQLHLDGFAGGDRTSLDLPSSQQQLLSRLQDLHKPLVIVLNSGSAVALGPVQEKASAVLAAWYPGEEGGHALANLLSGRSNPSGRLPVTFYRSAQDLPSFSDYSMAHRTYRYFSGPVLYPFGFGLSYAHFQYGPIHLSHNTVSAGESLTATVTLHNASDVAGSEVAELYVVPPQTNGAPHLALSGMQRVQLGPRESRELTFTLNPERMSFVDPAGKRAVRAGSYRLFVGGTQPDRASDKGAPFRVTGEKALDNGSADKLSQ
ncbi:glycoside hydrolase family 3 C-terminal domain-containing protein [Granulicella sp. S156]|uniref:glycoside hydrolase family 3 C-terminal domain-containing protein n=1 Tax=Granulicella sp. S156 TaxID=1747224 RepID=UPI00131DA8A5|nr:glycoside hydrolase family 3 C-terminal domain-containing protein [Granulicella sp. S156]